MFVAVILFLVFTIIMLFPVLPAGPAEVVSYLGRTVTALTGAAIMAMSARSASGALRRARATLAGVLALAACGGFVSSFFVVSNGAPLAIPSIADAAYFSLVPVVIFALLSYPLANEFTGSKLRALLDGLIAAACLGAVLYVFTLSPVLASSQQGILTQLTLLAYPTACVLIIGVTISMMLRVARSARRELAITCLGLAIISIEEVVFVAQKSAGTYQPNSWVAVIAELGLVLIVVGALSASSERTTSQVEPVEQVDGDSLWRLPFDEAGEITGSSNSWSRLAPLLPSLMVALVLVSCLVSLTIGHSFSNIDLVICLVLLSLLAIQQVVANRDRSALSSRLRSRGELFHSLVTGSSDLITLHNPSGEIRYASPAVLRVLGVSAQEITGIEIMRRIHPDDRADLKSEFERLLDEPSTVREIVLRLSAHTTPDISLIRDRSTEDPSEPQWRWMQVIAHNMIGDSSVQGIVCNSRDIHDQQILRQRLSFDAYHDALTGLGNLAHAREVLSEHCYGNDRQTVSVLMTDLDGFKTVNDTFGHAFGDELLVAVARRLSTCVADEDAVVRIGGDEFVLIFDSEQSATEAAEEILQQLGRPFLVDGTSISIDGSVGIARSVDASTPEELLRNADLAMYSAKEGGGGAARWYDPEMYETAASRLQIQEGIKRALEESRFQVSYQPIVGLPDGDMVGAEALIRWNDPELGFVSPEDFIPVAEGTGIISKIDQFMINTVCAQIGEWRRSGIASPQISVNVSRRQLSGGLVELIEAAIERNGVPTSSLCIEVTESAVIFDTDEAMKTLEHLRRLGVAVALDDFGTGQSSLSQLARLPIDKVKIDKSFVLNSSTQPAELRFLRSIVGVCQTLEIPIIAEGVEDEQAAQNLATMGAEYGQGFFFSRPLSGQDFSEMLANPIPAQRTAETDASSSAAEAEKGDTDKSTLEAKRSHLRAV